jgi:glycine oxidase
MKVVIVGAGVAGLAIGWRLREAGVEVTVLERAQPGHGATWAAAGMLSTIGENEGEHPTLTAFARYAAEQWPAFAHEIEEASGHGVGYRKDGKLIVAMNDDRLAHLAELAAAHPNVSILSAHDARAFEPLLSSGIAGALHDPSEAQVDNRALGVALTIAFLRAGGTLSANEAVVRIETDGARILGVRTPFDLHQGDAYVLAAGAWTSLIDGLPPETVPPVVPVKGEMIALTGEKLPTRILWGDDVYLVPRAGRLLVGATATQDGFDASLTNEAERHLSSAALALMQTPEAWTIADHWAGLRPGSPDGLPILGRSAMDGLTVASGQFRNGILFAPAVAEAASLLVRGQACPFDIAAFDPRRFDGAALAKDRTVG